MLQESIKKKVVAVDISIEKTVYAIVDIRGDVLVKDSFPTLSFPQASAFVSELCARIISMLEANECYDSVRSVGISSKSANFRSGCIENAANLPWKGIIPLAAMVRDQLGLAVTVANNPHVIAMAEHTFGLARGMRNFVIITLGNGLGSFMFSNGLPYLGNDGYAGEVGHCCVMHNGRLCGCGNRGCLESYVSTKGIKKTAAELLAESSEPSLMRGVEDLTPKMIAEFCEKGDSLSIEVYRRTGKWLGFALASFASLTNPQAFIFCGGISKAGKWLFDPTIDAFKAHAFQNTEDNVQFLVSQANDEDINLLGASVLAWEVKEYSLFK